jgi:hypothetical protein
MPEERKGKTTRESKKDKTDKINDRITKNANETVPLAVQPETEKEQNTTQKEPAVSAAPHEDQKRYWDKDLKYKKISLVISAVSFGLIVIGLSLNAYQSYLNTEQLAVNERQSKRLELSLRANVETSTITLVTNLDRVFIEKPFLRPYFYDSTQINEEDEKFSEAAATAEMMLDIFDIISTQSKNFPEYWSPPGAWDAWIIDMFSTSPILRNTFDKYQTWYGTDIYNLRMKAQDKLNQAR